MMKMKEKYYSKWTGGFIFAIAGIGALPFFFPGFELVAGGNHNNQRVIQLVILLAASLYAMCSAFCNRILESDAQVNVWVLWGGFFIFGALSGIKSDITFYSFLEWMLFLSLFVLSVLIAVEIKKNALEGIRKILCILGIGTCLYAATAMMLPIPALMLKAQPQLIDIIPGFDNWRFLNYTQTTVLPLLGLLLVIDLPGNDVHQQTGQRSASLIFFWKNYRHWLWWYATSAWWMLVFVSGARGTLMGIGAGTIAAWFLLRKRAWPWCRVMLLTALLGAVGYFLIYTLAPLVAGLQPFGSLGKVTGRTMAEPSSGRFELWRISIDLIQAHPWLGNGPMYFAHYAHEKHFSAHPHNWVLQIALEWGCAALACICAALYLSLQTLLRSARAVAGDDKKNQAISTAFLAGLVALISDGLVSGVIVMPVSQLWIAIYAGCAWGWVWAQRQESPATKNTMRVGIIFRFMLLFLLAALALLLGYALWDQIWGAGAEQLIEHMKNDDERWPRFWIYGTF